MKVNLVRLEETEQGTLGVLLMEGKAFCCTLEPPDKDNEANVSSIPKGSYMCGRRMSHRYGETFEVLDVPERSHILFHAGNVVDHTKGCILLGQYFGKLKGNRAVLNSGTTFKNFMAALKEVHVFRLVIEEPLWVAIEEPLWTLSE